MCAVCAMVAAFSIFWLLLCNSIEIHGPFSSFVFFVDQLCHNFETIVSRQFEFLPRYIIISCSLLIHHLLDSFFHFTSQNTMAFLVCNYFVCSCDSLGRS
jgi:hypothetical protein